MHSPISVAMEQCGMVGVNLTSTARRGGEGQRGKDGAVSGGRPAGRRAGHPCGGPVAQRTDAARIVHGDAVDGGHVQLLQRERVLRVIEVADRLCGERRVVGGGCGRLRGAVVGVSGFDAKGTRDDAMWRAAAGSAPNTSSSSMGSGAPSSLDESCSVSSRRRTCAKQENQVESLADMRGAVVESAGPNRVAPHAPTTSRWLGWR